MKIHQEQVFKPITIVLETREEAEAFWGIIDKIDLKSSCINPTNDKLTESERSLVIDLSDALTRGGVAI